MGIKENSLDNVRLRVQSEHSPNVGEIYKKIIEDNKEEDKIDDNSFD